VPAGEKHRVGSVGEFAEGHVRGFRIDGQDVAVVKRGERFIAFQNYCTHGAFSFDHLDLKEDGSLICVGHGAYFNLDTGLPFAGPAGGQLALYKASVVGDEVFVSL
jgi:nitrite reductase/ring-hydroxylating ferredoxin subunit